MLIPLSTFVDSVTSNEVFLAGSNPPQPAVAAASAVNFTSTYHGKHSSWVSLSAAPRNTVAGMLPNRITLTDHTSLPAGIRPANNTEYPVVIFAGKQADVKPIIEVGDVDLDFLLKNTLSALLGMNYLETIALIPYTVLDGGTDGHIYPHKLYLDDSTATLLGKVIFLPKEESKHMHMGPTTFTASDESAPTVPVVNVFEASRAHPAPSLAVVKVFQDLLQLPILGSLARLKDSTLAKSVAISRSRWDLEAKHIQPVSMTCGIGDELCVALTGSHTISPIANSPYGGFWMEAVPWTIPPPSIL